MTHYFFRQVGDHHIQISKIEDGDSVPKDVYDHKNGHCSCPASWNRARYRQHGCKHDKWINEWKLLPDKEKWYFDDSTGKFEINHMVLP